MYGIDLLQLFVRTLTPVAYSISICPGVVIGPDLCILRDHPTVGFLSSSLLNPPASMPIYSDSLLTRNPRSRLRNPLPRIEISWLRKARCCQRHRPDNSIDLNELSRLQNIVIHFWHFNDAEQPEYYINWLHLLFS